RAPAPTIGDEGAGMRRRELARYHDVAASAKARGAGIGFAGVGIKIALPVCAAVGTETRRGKTHVASTWRLASRHRAPWRWLAPDGKVAARGTAVRLVPESALSPVVDPGSREGVLRRPFRPLFAPGLAPILRGRYPRGVVVVLNGRALDLQGAEAPEVAPLAIRVGRQRKPAGAGYLVRMVEALPEELRGVAVSTFGKVIRRGWDWLALAPAAADRVSGLIEVPALAESLTLNKADFIRAGARGAIYLAYRKAIQEAVAHQLSLWGDSSEPAGARAARATRGGVGPPRRRCANSSANPLRAQDRLRGAARRSGARAPRRVHRVGQRSASRVPARRCVALGGLPHGARGRAGSGPAGRRSGEGARVHHRVPRELGRRDRAAEGPQAAMRSAGRGGYSGGSKSSMAMCAPGAASGETVAPRASRSVLRYSQPSREAAASAGRR